MQLANSKTQYGAIPQLVHWLTAVFVIAGWLLGTFGDDLPKGAAREFGLLTHMTLGEGVVLLLVLRLAWRIANPPPPPEATPFGRFVEAAAKLSHFALSALLVVVPFFGILVQLKRGHSLPIFGYWEFVSPWPANRPMARTLIEVHEVLADALLILAGIHAAAALLHHWLWRDRTLMRMLPGAA
jgi:cytochrome b561